jgi:hypothetical protein
MAALSLVSQSDTASASDGHPRAKRIAAIPSRSLLNRFALDIVRRDTEQVANDNAIGVSTVGQIRRRLGCSNSVAGRIRSRDRLLRVCEAAALARRAA